MRRRIVFAGTPAFGLGCLEALVEAHDVCAVYTQPDRPSGRGQKIQFSPIKSFALEKGIDVYQPVNFKSEEAIETLKALQPDALVVIAYGLILPKKVLQIPRFGCINVHGSILPYWRGAAPIQYSILKQDATSGVSIMLMDVGMDTGPVYEIAKCPLAPNETATSLHDKLAHLAIRPLLNTIARLDEPHFVPAPQVHEKATYSTKIDKVMAQIDWHQDAKVIDAQIRAFNPWPIAYTHCDSLLIKIHEAHPVDSVHHEKPGTVLMIDKNGIVIATQNNALSIQKLQFPGGKVLSVKDWLNASKQQLSVGVVLS